MNILEKLFFPKLNWVQLEISGLCNARCFYCPHTIYRKDWRSRNFSFGEFLKLAPYFEKIKLLYLQGWGEPFCNPEFFNILKFAKEKNCVVGTTTNGMLLEDIQLERIVNLKLDIIAFSLTGIEKNDVLREGTKIERIFQVIKELNSIKTRKRTLYPKINIAYMLLKSNIEELDEIPFIFKDKGINDIIISLLDFIPEDKLTNESIVPKTEVEYEEFKNKFLKIKNLGIQNNLNIYFNLSHPYKKRDICSEQPNNSLFINSLGYVAPCVFKGIPLERKDNLYFGNINEKTLFKIWNDKDYKNFRKIFYSGKIPYACEACNKLRIWEY